MEIARVRFLSVRAGGCVVFRNSVWEGGLSTLRNACKGRGGGGVSLQICFHSCFEPRFVQSNSNSNQTTTASLPSVESERFSSHVKEKAVPVNSLTGLLRCLGGIAFGRV